MLRDPHRSASLACDIAVVDLSEEYRPMKHVAFGGRLVMLGCGSIGQGVLPLILRHIDIPRERITILSGDPRGQDVAAEYGVQFAVTR